MELQYKYIVLSNYSRYEVMRKIWKGVIAPNLTFAYAVFVHKIGRSHKAKNKATWSR